MLWMQINNQAMCSYHWTQKFPNLLLPESPIRSCYRSQTVPKEKPRRLCGSRFGFTGAKERAERRKKIAGPWVEWQSVKIAPVDGQELSDAFCNIGSESFLNHSTRCFFPFTDSAWRHSERGEIYGRWDDVCGIQACVELLAPVTDERAKRRWFTSNKNSW